MSFGEIRAGKAFVELFTKDSTKGGLDGIKSKFGAFSAQIAKIGGLGVTAAASAVTAAVMKAVNTGANIQDLADRYSLGTTAIQQLSFAAKQSGADLDTLIVAIKNMQKGLGNGTLGDELNAVGLSVKKLAGLSPEKQFEMIAEALGGISDPAQKTALAMKFFGKSGTDLIPLLKSGEGGVKALTAEFDKMGVTMSEDAVKQAAAFDDELVKLGVEFDALVVSIGSSLIPAIRNAMAAANELRDANLNPLSSMALQGIAFTEAVNLLNAGAISNPMGAIGAGAAAGAAPGPARGPGFALEDYFASVIASISLPTGGQAERAVTTAFRSILDDMQSMLYGVGIGRRQMRGENIAAMPGNALNAIYGYLSGSPAAKVKSDVASFGTFDKRDIAGGAYLQASQLQLAELKKIEKDLDEIKKKKAGVPWG